MGIGDWVAVVTLFTVLAAAYATILVKLATKELSNALDAVATRIKLIEDNHLPSLAKRLKALPCQEHSEEDVKLTVRLESVTERLERLERRQNGVEA